MKPHRIELYRGADGRWRYRRRAGNWRIVEASEQGFRSKWFARRRALRTAPPGAVVVTVDE